MDEIQVEFAEHFQLGETENEYVIKILDPETHSVDETLLIDKTRECKMISLSSTTNGMLDFLGTTDVLVGISSIDYVQSTQISSRFDEGKISEFGDETNFSLEKVIASGANTILYSGFGDDFPNRKKLEKLDFSLIPVYDWREVHPLGKAEWIKVVGILCGEKKLAMDIFDIIKREYEATKTLVENVRERPTVLAGHQIGDIWYAPAGESYMAQLIADAGGDYVYKSTKGTGSIERSIEEILTENENTTYWLNPGMSEKQLILQSNPHVKHLKAFDNTYCYSEMMDSYWESSASTPHLVLSDLIKIFHPDVKSEEVWYLKEWYFYEKVN